MPAGVSTPSITTGPREELSLVIVEAENAVRNCIGEEIMPPFPLTARTAHLPKMLLQNTLGMRLLTDKKFYRAPGTLFPRMMAQVNDFVFQTNMIGAEILVPLETKAEWDRSFDLINFFTARAGGDWTKLTKESLVAATIFNTTNTFQGSATNATAAYTQANQQLLGPNGMNPILDIINATRYGKTIGELYDYAVMSGPVWERVTQCQNTLQFVKGVLFGITEVNINNFTEALKPYGIKKVLVGDAYYNNAQDQDTPALVQIWSNTYMAVGRMGMSQTPSDEDNDVGVPTIAGVGVSAFWQGFDQNGGGTTETPDGINIFEMAGGNYVSTYWLQERNSVAIRVGISDNPTVTNNKCNYLIATGYV